MEAALQLQQVPQGTISLGLMPSTQEMLAPLQPCADVAAYRANRKPCAFHDANAGDQSLFLTLFADVAEETIALEKAVRYVQSLAKGGLKVSRAVARALDMYHRAASIYGWKEKAFRATYDRWAKSQDWVDLVNHAKAPASWREGNVGLPETFLRKCVAVYFQRFNRKDGKEQAIQAIHRWWRTGKNIDGDLEPIPGYEVLADGHLWSERNTELLPAGFEKSNIRRQMKARGLFTEADRAFNHEGTAAAKEYLPQIPGTRNNLRFLEEVTFDDVRTDALIFEAGQECELWLLVARDSATRMVLGFVPHVSRVREDGSASHLGLKEMKQLVGFLLERYPLPPYLVTFRVERGTATLSESERTLLQALLPDRIRITYTSMIGGKSARGYDEKKKGNSRGKGSHESHNRLLHTQYSFVPGQIGANYSIRPADLNARVEECKETWAMRERLPKHLRGQEQYTLLTLRQACDHLFQLCLHQNFRTEHAIEGFEKVLEWYDPSVGKWRHQSEYVGGTNSVSPKYRTRMERPVERAIKLMEGYQWERVSTDIIIAFYEHSARPVVVKGNGEIEFKIDGRKIIFAPPVAGPRQPISGVGYFHPDDPQFLHVTTGKGNNIVILGTWVRRNRVAIGDQEALAQAMRYTDAALKAVQTYAEELTATERQQIADIRAHNAELAKAAQFIDVASPELSVSADPITSPLTAALNAVGEERAQTRATKDREAEEAAEAILAPNAISAPDETDAGNDLLKLLSGK